MHARNGGRAQKSGFTLLILLPFLIMGCGGGYTKDPVGSEPFEPTATLVDLPTPTSTPAALFPSGRMPGIFLSQIDGMVESLPGLIDINAVTPVDTGEMGESAFIVGTDDLQKTLNNLGLAIVTGKVVTTNEAGDRIMLDNIASYRDQALRGFQLALPDRIIFDNNNVRSIIPLKLITWTSDLDGDGSAEWIGMYEGDRTYITPGVLPVPQEYEALVIVPALVNLEANFGGITYPPGTFLAVALQKNQDGTFSLIDVSTHYAIPMLYPPEVELRATRQVGSLLLEALNRQSRAVELSFELVYDKVALGLPVKYAELQQVLPGYDFRLVKMDGRVWVWAVNEQDKVIRFPEDVRVTGNWVIGYSERNNDLWELQIFNNDGVISIKATRLVDVTWITLTPSAPVP